MGHVSPKTTQGEFSKTPFLLCYAICFSSQLFVGLPATFNVVNNVLYFCDIFN